jgi:Family of unknown function (DUF5947)
MSAATGLHRFVARRPVPTVPDRFTERERRPVGEHCEMCGENVLEQHAHVVDLDTRRLLCACRPCMLLFTAAGAGRGNFRAVPERYLTDPQFLLDAAQWEQLQVPVSMAFFFHNSVLDRVVAHYPSPAGATESLLDLAAWEEVVAANPLAAALAPDVEALVVRRAERGEGQDECYLVPIDACYELVGRLRMHWSGFDGGAEVRADLESFFADLRDRARTLTVSHIDG